MKTDEIYFKRRVTETQEIVEVTAVNPVVYKTRDGRSFRDHQLDTVFPRLHRKDSERRIPDFLLEDILTLIRNRILPHRMITLLPTGRDTPMCLGTRIRCVLDDEWEISVYDWFGDRCSNCVLEHKSLKGRMEIEDIIYYALRDTFEIVNSCYPGDPYVLKVLRAVYDVAPEYFDNKDFFKREYAKIYE